MKLTTGKKWIAVGVVVAGVSFVLWSKQHAASGDGPQPNSKNAPGVSGLRFQYAPGVEYVYSLRWSSNTAGELAAAQGATAAPALDVASEVEADVAIRGVEESAEGILVSVSFKDLRRFNLSLSGQQAVRDIGPMKTELEGKEALVLMSGSGEVKSVSFHADASPTLRSTMANLVKAVSVTLPEGDEAEWQAKELTSNGLAVQKYSRAASTLRRTTERYESIPALGGEALTGAQTPSGTDTITIGGDGALLSLHSTQSLTYVRKGTQSPGFSGAWTFELDRKQRAVNNVAVNTADLQAQKLGDLNVDPGLPKRRDERLAEGVTTEQLEVESLHFKKGSKVPQNFLVKAGAYLRLHPEEDAKLAQRFKSGGIDTPGRGLILDVLSQAGDKPAQDAMREALASDAAKAGDFSILVQRFSFVGEPTAETVDFLKQTYASAMGKGDTNALQGTASALGAVANKLRLEGKEGEARDANGLIVSDLNATPDPAVKRGLLAALGNARLPEDLMPIRQLSGDKDTGVRAQVAYSLRGFDSPDARTTLLELAADPSSSVSANAIGSLGQQSLAASDWSEIAARAADGRINANADHHLVNLVRVKREDAGEYGDTILRAVLMRVGNSTESDLPQIIQGMLGS